MLLIILSNLSNFEKIKNPSIIHHNELKKKRIQILNCRQLSFLDKRIVKYVFGTVHQSNLYL